MYTCVSECAQVSVRAKKGGEIGREEESIRVRAKMYVRENMCACKRQFARV